LSVCAARRHTQQCVIRASSPPLALLLFLFYSPRDHRDLHSFPTRRSSDLLAICAPSRISSAVSSALTAGGLRRSPQIAIPTKARSEEHTSELQSHLNLVCRLLLEKKKKNITHIYK